MSHFTDGFEKRASEKADQIQKALSSKGDYMVTVDGLLATILPGEGTTREVAASKLAIS